MYISCYRADETNFEHHGEFKVFVDVEDNNIYRAINGQFYATFKVALDDRHLFDVQHRMIVKLPTPNKRNPYQLFRIMDSSEDDTGVVFTAFHIAWDLAADFLPHINIVGKTRKEACDYILLKSQESQPHRFSIIDTTNPPEQKNLQIVRYNPLVALMGSQDNTIRSRYGKTEFDFDNFTISVCEQLGQETSFLIKDDKNILSYNKNLDFKPIATRIIPQGANELMLPEYYLDSPKIGAYDRVFYKHVKFEEIGIDVENGITEAVAINLLREAALKLFSEANIDSPYLNWTIVFDDDQSNPKVPSEIKELLKLDLGDSVLVSKMGLFERLSSRILEYNFNFVKGSYTDITISSTSKNFTISQDKVVADLQFKIDNFTSTITNLSQDLYSKIEQTEKSILLEVNNVKDGLSSTIEQTATSIRAEVTDVEKGLNSKIEQTATSITSTVSGNYTDLNGKITTANSKIQQNADSIKTKVDVNGVKSTIQQNPDSVKIGFNEINDVIEMTELGLKVNHGSSYSLLSGSGLTRYDGSTGKQYHYLSYMGQVDLASEERATIQLPSEFRGRDFKVIVSVKRVRIAYDPYAEKHLLLGFYAEAESVDTTNASFRVYASVRAIKSTNLNGQLTGADYGHDILRPVVAYWVYA